MGLARNLKNLAAFKKALADPRIAMKDRDKILQAEAALKVLVKREQRRILSSGKTAGNM